VELNPPNIHIEPPPPSSKVSIVILSHYLSVLENTVISVSHYCQYLRTQWRTWEHSDFCVTLLSVLENTMIFMSLYCQYLRTQWFPCHIIVITWEHSDLCVTLLSVLENTVISLSHYCQYLRTQWFSHVSNCCQYLWTQ
jgi:hypothetical protein